MAPQGRELCPPASLGCPPSRRLCCCGRHPRLPTCQPAPTTHLPHGPHVPQVEAGADDSAHLASRVEAGDGFLVTLGKTHPVVA